MYRKTDVLGLQAFLWERLNLWVVNARCLEELWVSYKDIIFEGIKLYAYKKNLSKNPDPGYYIKEAKGLNLKKRNIYNKRKFEQTYQTEMKRLSKKLLVAKRKAQETLLRSVLQNEGRR